LKRFYLKTINMAWIMLVLSIILYEVDYLVSGKALDIAFGFLGNLAFLPIYVLFVTLIIERILREREKLNIRQKMNMVIGVFFSEVGTALMGDYSHFLANRNEFAAQLRVGPQWTNRDFAEAENFLKLHQIEIDCRLGDLAELKKFLIAKRNFMLGLLENPNLLEHDDFTDLLWAVFHLTEELDARENLEELPQSDLDHLASDIRRVFHALTRQWVLYIQHLKADYPYLFSLALRKNPMNPDARVVVM